jgi:hypothetical protein
MRYSCFFPTVLSLLFLLACCSDYVYPVRMSTYHTRPIRFPKHTAWEINNAAPNIQY